MLNRTMIRLSLITASAGWTAVEHPGGPLNIKVMGKTIMFSGFEPRASYPPFRDSSWLREIVPSSETPYLLLLPCFSFRDCHVRFSRPPVCACVRRSRLSPHQGVDTGAGLVVFDSPVTVATFAASVTASEESAV